MDSASISSLVADTKSSLVNLRGNPNLTLDKSLLDFLEATDLDPQNFFPTESVLCQKAKLAGTQGIQLYLNPPQRHFAQCICQDAMRGSHMIWNPSQGNCATLPDSTASAVLFDSLINVSAARIAVAPGFYPTAFFSEPNSSKWDLSTLQLVTCHFAPACRSAIPDNQLADFVGDLLKAPPDFQCAPGYDDFMCSRCVPGYFAVETQCFECFTASSVIVPIITAAVALTVLVGLWSSNESSNGSVAADLCFFFLQLLHILPFSASTLAHRFESTSSSVLSLLYFRLFAADCIDPSLDATSRPLVSLIVVLAIPFVCWVAATLSYCHRACKAAEEDRDGIWSECKHQAFEFGWTLVELVYFPVADSVITTFNCTQQAGFTFLTYAPYIDCTSSTYSQMWNISVALLVIFVAPFPLVSVFRYRRAGKDQELPMIRDPYRLWWWMPVIYTGRALYLSLFVGLLHWNSPWLAPAVFLMLLVSLVSVLELKPYKNRWENYLEAAILVAAAILYAAYFTDSNVFSSNYRLIDGQDALPVTIAALSIAFKTVAASIIAWSLASNTRLVKYLRQKFFPDSTTTTASELQSIEPSYLPIF